MSEKKRILADMPNLHDFFQKLNLVNALGMFLLIVIFFILRYILDMEFVCSCLPGVHQNGIVYLAIPPGILTWVVYVTEPFHRARIFSVFGSFSDNKIFWFCVELLSSYLSLSALWIAAVLLDGDWFICLKTNLNSNQTGIPCKKDLTYEENQIKAGYKTESLDYGLYLIGSFLCFWSIIEVLTAGCIRERTWKRGSGSDMLLPPYYRKVYEGLLEEQASVHLKEELTKIAAKRTKAICQPHLQTIGDHEQQFKSVYDGNDSANNTVFEAWKKISASDFQFSSNESHVEAEMVAEDPAWGMDSGSTSSDRRLMT